MKNHPSTKRRARGRVIAVVREPGGVWQEYPCDSLHDAAVTIEIAQSQGCEAYIAHEVTRLRIKF